LHFYLPEINLFGRKPLEQYHRVGLVPLAERWWKHLKNRIEAMA
jgi:hypothetical protein